MNQLRSKFIGASLSIGVTVALSACGQVQDRSGAVPAISDLSRATEAFSTHINIIDEATTTRHNREQLLDYWHSQPAVLKTAAVSGSTSVVYVKQSGNVYSVVSLDTSSNQTAELFRTTSPIQSAAATAGGRLLTISARNPYNGKYDVYRIQPAQGTIERLTSNPLDDLNVSITADGETVVWETVQQEYVSGGGASKVMFRDWGTGTGVDYTIASSGNLRFPSISADGTVISMTNKPVGQTFTSISNYYTNGQFFYEVARSSSAVTHPSASDGGHQVTWLDVTNGTSTVKHNNVDTTVTTNFASSTSPLDHPHLSANGASIVVAENQAGRYQGYQIGVSTGTVVAIGDPTTSNTAFAWQAGAGATTAGASTNAQVSGTLLNGQTNALTLTAGNRTSTLSASEGFEQDLQVRFEDLSLTPPAPLPNDDLMSGVASVMVGNFRLQTDKVGTIGGAQMRLALQNPDPNRYNRVYLYTWDGERYLPWCKLASAQEATTVVAEFSPLLARDAYGYGVQVVAFAANDQDLRTSCVNKGGRFNSVECDVDVSPSISTQGINDNKLTVFSVNVGNVNCLGSPYVVKLCAFDAEIGTKALISGVNADVVLLQEVFNDNCNRDTTTSVVGFVGNVCSFVERNRREIPETSKQIERILPLTRYDYRCAEAKTTADGSAKYSGYECIAVKKGFVSFATPASTAPYLQGLNPNCEANPKLTGASLSPQAVSGPFTGSDTGIWLAPLKAEGYSQTFYAATAHLASPPFHTCRNAQLTAFADWHRAAGSPKYILGGDMNTDPNYQLYPGGPFSDRGTTAYLTYFFDTEDSLSRNYNPSSLGTRIGYTLDNSEEPTASFPLHVPSAVSLDHIVSNFASPYSATQQACTRRDRIFNYDHKPTICGFNIARIR